MAASDKKQASERATPTTMDRRGFVQTLGAVGAVGAIAGGRGIGTTVRAQAAQAAGAPQAAAADDFPRPATLRPGAQLDSRSRLRVR